MHEMIKRWHSMEPLGKLALAWWFIGPALVALTEHKSWFELVSVELFFGAIALAMWFRVRHLDRETERR